MSVPSWLNPWLPGRATASLGELRLAAALVHQSLADLLRRSRQLLGTGGPGPGEAEVAHGIDGIEMDMGMGDLQPNQRHAHPPAGKGHLEAPGDALGDDHQVTGQLLRQVVPVVHLLPGNHQYVTGPNGLGGHDGKGPVVLPDKVAGQLTGENAAEYTGHGTSCFKNPPEYTKAPSELIPVPQPLWAAKNGTMRRSEHGRVHHAQSTFFRSGRRSASRGDDAGPGPVDGCLRLAHPPSRRPRTRAGSAAPCWWSPGPSTRPSNDWTRPEPCWIAGAMTRPGSPSTWPRPRPSWPGAWPGRTTRRAGLQKSWSGRSGPCARSCRAAPASAEAIRTRRARPPRRPAAAPPVRPGPSGPAGPPPPHRPGAEPGAARPGPARWGAGARAGPGDGGPSPPGPAGSSAADDRRQRPPAGAGPGVLAGRGSPRRRRTGPPPPPVPAPARHPPSAPAARPETLPGHTPARAPPPGSGPGPPAARGHRWQHPAGGPAAPGPARPGARTAPRPRPGQRKSPASPAPRCEPAARWPPAIFAPARAAADRRAPRCAPPSAPAAGPRPPGRHARPGSGPADVRAPAAAPGPPPRPAPGTAPPRWPPGPRRPVARPRPGSGSTPPAAGHPAAPSNPLEWSGNEPPPAGRTGCAAGLRQPPVHRGPVAGTARMSSPAAAGRARHPATGRETAGAPGDRRPPSAGVR